MSGELDDIFAGAETDLANAPARHRPEAERQKDAREAAEKEGWYSFKWSSPKHAGVVDVIYMRPVRRIVFVEYKVPGKEPTALQEVCMKLLTFCGFPCYVCYDTDDTLAVLSKH